MPGHSRDVTEAAVFGNLPEGLFRLARLVNVCPFLQKVPAKKFRPKGSDCAMSYHSTRGQAPALAFDDVLLAGLARDGGLYLPEQWPAFLARGAGLLRRLDLCGTWRCGVMRPFLDGVIAEDDFAALVTETYGRFRPCRRGPP